MSDIGISQAQPLGFSTKPATFDVEEIYWGYTVHTTRRPRPGMVLAQTLSFFFGAVFLTAAIGMLVLPALLFAGQIDLLRIGSAVLFGAMAVYLLWFSSRGSRVSLQVDNSEAEVREVVINRAGRPTIVGAYSFCSIGGVFIERHDQDDDYASLLLRYRNTAQTMLVAEGTEAQLIALRDRLARDLMVGHVAARAA